MDREALRGVGGEDAPLVRIDTVGQTAAGGLLLGIAIMELVLGFWAAGWHHRAVALAVAGVGLTFLASGVVEIAGVRKSRPGPSALNGSTAVRAPGAHSAPPLDAA